MAKSLCTLQLTRYSSWLVQIEPIIFGCAFEGVDIKKIMGKSDDLFGVGGASQQKLLEHTSNSNKEDIVK